MKTGKGRLLYLALGFSLLFLGCATSPVKEADLEGSRVVKISIPSKSLGIAMNVNVYLPATYPGGGKYSVLYLLHGITDNEDKWTQGLRVQDNLDRLIGSNEIQPLIVVMPDIDNSFGINTDKARNFPAMISAGKYEDYIIKELIPYIDKRYSTVANRSGRYIGGLSMGGWAALYLAFTHNELFSRVGGHSPAIINDDWLYPNFDLRNKRDPIALASNKKLENLHVYLDCGDADSFKFFEGCGRLYKELQGNGVPSEYHLNSGGHDDAYWMANIDTYLRFYGALRSGDEHYKR
jgi:enterochelin esterase-like enzyme